MYNALKYTERLEKAGFTREAEIQELRAEIKQMESRLTLKLGGMLIAAITVMEFLRSS